MNARTPPEEVLAESGVLGTRVLRRPWLLAILLGAAVIAIFWRVARNEFVNYDDPDYITSNPHVLAGLSWVNLVWALTTGHASNWHPLTWLSHMLDCQLFGQRASGHHLVSAGLHLVNTLLLFGWLRLATGALWRSSFVAALFALHPLHVESVAWASERKDVLSGFFFFLTLIAYTRYVRLGTDQASGRQRIAWRSGLWCSFALGLASKPMLVTVPFLLCLLDYWPLKRFRFPGGPSPIYAEGSRRSSSGAGFSTDGTAIEVGKRSKKSADAARPQSATATGPAGGQPATKLALETAALGPRRAGALFFEKLPLLVLSVLSSVVTFLVQRRGGAVSSLGTIDVSARLANAVVAYVRYLGKLVWPVNLAVLYPHPIHWPTWTVLLCGAFLIVISALSVISAGPRPYLAVGWFWFLGMLVPVIGLVQVGLQSMADRYTYLPLVGIFIALVWGASGLVRGTRWEIECVVLGTVTALVTCAMLTIRQLGFWETSETLFRRTATVTEGNFLAYNNLGFYLSAAGRVDEAMQCYRKALEINPNYEDAHNNLGYALAGRKQYAEAIAQYEAALKVRPDHVEVHNNLGNALADVGRVDEAMEHYRFVLRQSPNHADANNNLGIALAMRGQIDEAIPHFEAAIRGKANYASAHSNLGNALAAEHRLPEAVAQYQEALRLNPADAQAHNNLGNALAELGRLVEAVPQYEAALRLNQDNPEAHLNLGVALVRLGKRDEAIAHFASALQLRPGYKEAQQQLDALRAAAPSP